MNEHFWAVVPAGGAGTRLWPLSRAGSPKFLHDLTGQGRTLLQSTHDRLAPMVGDRVMVVTGQAHADAVMAQLPELAPENVIREPSARDSMAAIGLAAALLERRDPQAVMGSFAADHVIGDPEEFRRVLASAVKVAGDDWLVTVGIAPTHPATGFGYIRSDRALDHQGAFEVAEFVEKPDVRVAEDYVARGYQWNAGMFVVRPGVLLDLLGEQDPDFAAALRSIAAAPHTLPEVWDTLPRIALDHAVAEPAAAAGRVAVVPGDFGWDDVGDFASLRNILDAEGSSTAGAVTTLGEPGLVQAIDSDALVVAAGGRLIAVIGVEDLVVVDTEDAVLVTTRTRAQDVKQIVAALKQDGHDQLV